MTYAAIIDLAQHHEKAAASQFEAAKGMGDCPAAERFRAAGVRHVTWASDLCGLVEGNVEMDAPPEQLRHALTMSVRVIAAMERERRELCAEIARLNTQTDAPTGRVE